MSSSANLPSPAEISAALDQRQKKEDHEFSALFQERRTSEPDKGWDVLQAVFGFQFRASNASEPFTAMSVWEGKRSMIPSDLTEYQLTALESTVDGVADPEFRARILDVLWLRKRDASRARAAVEAYLQTGSRLEGPQHWVASMRRYERALRLARQVEAKGELPKTVLRHLEGRVLHYNGSDPLYFTQRALELLAEFSFGQFDRLAEIAGRLAREARATGDFDRARSHFAVQAHLLKAAKCYEGVEVARVAEAECWAEEADRREKGWILDRGTPLLGTGEQRIP